MEKVFSIVQVPATALQSHVGNTYVISSAQYPDQIEDDRHVLRQVKNFKEICDSSAEKAGKKVKYYHITVMAVYEKAVGEEP